MGSVLIHLGNGVSRETMATGLPIFAHMSELFHNNVRNTTYFFAGDIPHVIMVDKKDELSPLDVSFTQCRQRAYILH